MQPVERVIIDMVILDYINYATWYGGGFHSCIFCENIFIGPNKNKRVEYPFWSEIIYIIFCVLDSFKNSFLFMLSVESEKMGGIHMIGWWGVRIILSVD